MVRRIADNVYALPSGLFQVRILLGWRPSRDGRRVRNRLKRSFETKDLAVEFRDEARRQWRYRSAGVVVPEAPRLITLATAGAAHLREVETLKRTRPYLLAQRRYVALVCEALGGSRPLPLRRDDMVSLIEYLRAHSASHGAMIREIMATVATMHRRVELPPPARPEVTAPAPTKRRMDLPTLLRFLAALPRGSIERAVAFTTLLSSGRYIEVRRLRRADVDLDAGTITFERRKGARVRAHGPKVGVIGDALRKELATYIKKHSPAPDEYLFSLTPHEPISDAGLNPYVRAACVRAGIPPFTGLGWLRNEAGTLMDELGIEPRVIQRVLGHRDFGVTERHYAQGTRLAAQRDAARALGRLLSGGLRKGQRKRRK